jgi:hypothetical protein
METWKVEVVAYLKYYLGIYLEVLKETTVNHSKGSWSTGNNLNPGHSDYDAEASGDQ